MLCEKYVIENGIGLISENHPSGLPTFPSAMPRMFLLNLPLILQDQLSRHVTALLCQAKTSTNTSLTQSPLQHG